MHGEIIYSCYFWVLGNQFKEDEVWAWLQVIYTSKYVLKRILWKKKKIQNKHPLRKKGWGRRIAKIKTAILEKMPSLKGERE